MPEEVNLIVARAKISGGVDIEPEAPEEVRGTQGDRILVKFPFRYEEVSKHDDSFRLQLTSRLGDKEAAPATYAHQDRRGVTDDKWGYVSQEYTLDAPGDQELTFRVAVEHIDGDETFLEDLSGTVKVVVSPAARAAL